MPQYLQQLKILDFLMETQEIGRTTNCDMNLSFGYLVAFIIVQGCGFILYLVVSYNYLRDHYRIMQGVMKCIVLSYFWVKLLTLFLMITLMSVWSQLQDNDRASQMLEVG